MRSSPSERPLSSSGQPTDRLRGSTPGESRGRLPTLIGVAPAAPIVSGRPPSAHSTHPLEDASDAPASARRDTAAPPAPRTRPRADTRAPTEGEGFVAAALPAAMPAPAARSTPSKRSRSAIPLRP